MRIGKQKSGRTTGGTIRDKFSKNIAGWLLLLPAVLVLYFFVIRPQVLGFYWSFFRMRGFKVVDFVGIDNYIRVISDTTFLKNLSNTFQYVFWSLIIGYPLPIILALMLNEAVHLRKTLRFMVYFPSILPGVATSLLWYFLFNPTSGGLLNTILGSFGIEPYVWLQDSKFTILYIVISMTWTGCGATVLYYFAALQGVSRELYEAAIIDGAGFFKRMRVVALPYISNISLLFLVRQIIGVFAVLDQPMQMTDGGPNGASMTLGLQIYRYGFVDYRPEFAMALGVIMFLILMVVTIFYFKLERNFQNRRCKMFSKQMDKGILTNVDMKMGKYKLLYSVIMTILLLWCLGICFYPILWILLSGFKDVEELYAIPATFFPKNFRISKLVQVWNEMKIWKTYGNTFILAGGAAVFNMLFSGLAGYTISKVKPIGTKVVFMMLFWIMLLPGTMNTVPIYMTIMDFPLCHFNMLDSYLPLWLMAINAFDIILFKNFFDGIPEALVEAARIDGASNIRIFWRIIAPLSVPVFCVVGIFTFNGNIGSFLMPLLTLTDKNKTVLAVQLYKMKSANFTMDYQMLAVIFSMIPQIVVFTIFQKQIIGGINVGGVKG